MTARNTPAAAAVISVMVAVATSRTARSVLTRNPPGGASRWTRTNHRGESVSLLEGPAMALGLLLSSVAAPRVSCSVRAAGVVAAAGAGAFGVLDDLAEQGDAKGLRGHLRSLRQGHVTTGVVKIAGIGATGMVAAALARPAGKRSSAAQLATAGALIAGCANLANLLDLRPGRTLKVALLASPGLLGSGPAAALIGGTTGAALGLLGADLREQTMLGDSGANAVGAVLGTALVASTGRRAQRVALGVILGLTLLSEKVSFTRVIESTPGLREFDALGRRPRVP